MTTVDVTLGQDHAIGVLIFNIHIADLHEQLLRLFVVTRGAFGLGKVIVEYIVVDKVTPDGVHVHQHLLELFVEEKGRGHALTTWYCITFCGRTTH